MKAKLGVIIYFLALIELYYHVSVIDSFNFATIIFISLCLLCISLSRIEQCGWPIRYFLAGILGGLVSMLVQGLKSDIRPVPCDYLQFILVSMLFMFIEFITFRQK